MKSVKLGIAALTAASIALAVGANSASPTALCEFKASEGACISAYQAGTFVEGEAEDVRFETSVGDVECVSYLEDEVSKPPTPKGKTAQSFIWSLPFSACTLEGAGCTIETLNLSYRGVYLWTSGNDGTMELVEDGFHGPPSVKIVCGKQIDCLYRFESPLDVKGAATGATISAKEDALGNAKGLTCPGAGSPIAWSATYTLNEPSGGRLYMADYAPAVNLCKKNETPCSLGETYGVPTSLSARLETGAKAKFKVTITEGGKATEYTVACESSNFATKTTSADIWPLSSELTSLTFSECGGTCAVTALKLPYAANFNASGSGNGGFEMVQGGGGAPPRLQVNCIGAYKCTYETSLTYGSVTGGAPAKMVVGGTMTTRVAAESDEKCGAQLPWEGKYEFTKPEAGGVAKMWIVREGI